MSRDSVRSFVNGLINVFPGFLQSPVRWVADRIFGVWDEIWTLLVLVGSVWPAVSGALHSFLDRVQEVAVYASSAIRWIAVIALPKWAQWAINLALGQALQALAVVRTLFSSLIDGVRNWAAGLISGISKGLSDLLKWVTDRIKEVWSTLTVIRDRVVQLLTSPSSFVDWIFSALWSRFWRFLNDHLESIGTAVWGRRDSLIASSLARLETWLARVL